MTGPHLNARIFAAVAEFPGRAAEHQDGATKQWIGFCMKGVPKRPMTDVEAVEGALWGWIVGLSRRLDGQRRASRGSTRLAALRSARRPGIVQGPDRSGRATLPA